MAAAEFEPSFPYQHCSVEEKQLKQPLVWCWVPLIEGTMEMQKVILLVDLNNSTV